MGRGLQPAERFPNCCPAPTADELGCGDVSDGHPLKRHHVRAGLGDGEGKGLGLVASFPLDPHGLHCL